MINKTHARKLIPTAVFINEKLVVFQCMSCRTIVSNSQHIEEVYLACMESENEDLTRVLYSCDIIKNHANTSIIIDQSEIHVAQISAEEQFDIYCVYSLVKCKGCNKAIGRFYISTTEELDMIKDKALIGEEAVMVYALETNSYVASKEFFFSELFASSNTVPSRHSKPEEKPEIAVKQAPFKRATLQESFAGESFEGGLDESANGSSKEIFKELSTILEVFSHSLNELNERSISTERIVKEITEFLSKHTRKEKAE